MTVYCQFAGIVATDRFASRIRTATSVTEPRRKRDLNGLELAIGEPHHFQE
jgi:hypothetical protein